MERFAAAAQQPSPTIDYLRHPRVTVKPWLGVFEIMVYIFDMDLNYHPVFLACTYDEGEGPWTEPGFVRTAARFYADPADFDKRRMAAYLTMNYTLDLLKIEELYETPNTWMVPMCFS